MAATAAIVDFRSETILAFFYISTCHPDASYQISIGLLVQEEKQKIYFQDGRHGGQLVFPIGTILAIFDRQVTPILPTKFRVSWPRGVGGVGF